MDSGFINALEHVILAPNFIDRILDATFAHDPDAERVALTDERDRLAREIENLTKAIATSGDIPSLVTMLSERDKRLNGLDAKLAKAVVLPDREALKAALELRSADWRNILRGPHVAQARVVLQHLLDLPIKVTNQPIPKFVKKGDKRGSEPTHDWRGDHCAPKWIAAARPESLALGLIQSVASLMTASWNQNASWLKQIEGLRETA